jgi:hypothetical protein
MNNRRLEYNPLFESVTETAKKYSKINEEGQTLIDTGTAGAGGASKGSEEYKIKYAKEYAIKIFQLIYDEYIYFMNSIQDETAKQKYAQEILDFLKANSQKSDINFEIISKEILTKWESMNSSSEVKKIAESSDDFRKAYQDIAQAIKNFTLLLNSYSQKYGKELSNNSVMTAIKSFVNTALSTLSQAQQEVKK